VLIVMTYTHARLCYPNIMSVLLPGKCINVNVRTIRRSGIVPIGEVNKFISTQENSTKPFKCFQQKWVCTSVHNVFTIHTIQFVGNRLYNFIIEPKCLLGALLCSFIFLFKIITCTYPNAMLLTIEITCGNSLQIFS